jgi:hypothetical protein
MRIATAPPEWLEGIYVELTELDVLADLDPGFLTWEPITVSASR